jgi:hypothetical protein
MFGCKVGKEVQQFCNENVSLTQGKSLGEVKTEFKLMEKVCMSDKTINHIGWGLGLLVTIVIVCLSDCWNCRSQGVLSIYHDETIYWDILKQHGGYWLSRNYTGLLRLFILFIGFWLSFKFRVKIGKTVAGSIGNFHKKV